MSTRRRTDSGRATRARIVAATAEQILAAGIGGTTLDTVRAATLTSKSQLFHYFPGGKTELVREVAAWEGEQLLAAQAAEVHDLGTWASWERWRAGLVAYYIGRGRWACPIGSLAAQAAMVDADLQRTLAAWTADWRRLLADGIRRMQAAGLVEPTDDADRVAAAVLAAIHGGLAQSQLERASWPLEAALDHALGALRRPRTRERPDPTAQRRSSQDAGTTSPVS